MGVGRSELMTQHEMQIPGGVGKWFLAGGHASRSEDGQRPIQEARTRSAQRLRDENEKLGSRKIISSDAEYRENWVDRNSSKGKMD